MLAGLSLICLFELKRGSQWQKDNARAVENREG